MSDINDQNPPPPPPPGYGAGGTPPPPPGYGGAPDPAAGNLAEIGPRVIAFLIDWVAIPVGGWIAVAILTGIIATIVDALGLVVALAGYAAIFAFVLWNLYQEGTTGQTVGKKQQSIRLVGLENGGQPIGFGMAFVRALVNNLPCYLGWLLAFADKDRQTLGDKVSKSVVVAA